MLIHPLAHLDLARDRERDLIAQAERHRLSRGVQPVRPGRLSSPPNRRSGSDTMQGVPPRSPTIRELAHRVSGGVEVTLLWNVHENRLAVAVSDPRSGESFVIDTEHSKALDVFNHPYAHAGFQTAA